MFAFLKRKSKERGLTGVSFDAQGFGIAHVTRADDGTPTLEVCDYRECREPEELAHDLSAAIRELGLRGTECVCVPRPGTYTVRQVERPRVDEIEMRDAARWAIADLIDFNAADAVIDTFDIPPSEVRRDAPRRMYVIAARKPDIDAASSAIRRAGLQLKAIDITELALRNVAALLPQDERGVALMYLATDPGLVGMTRQGSLILTRSIEADRIAIEGLAGHELSDIKSDLTMDAEQVLEGFLLEVQRSLDYLEHQLGQPPIPNLVIAPMEWPVPAIRAYMDQNLFSMEVTSLDVNDLLACREPLTLTAQARCLPTIGAALRVEESA